ncbi:CBS domain-containing protein [Candidatus Contubernalis alkaliaceticus]|uniref:CBS domain-containing protein n=1 Tax=Candidatus Contubernalis alkaliaceticus TaxID=338645 RepID=UPI001F4BDA83|nr:CBS domain-containing protein [Candidatus Contubernalis alkalaceticus]UNC90666.1 CBS domain-containing protein [Candidatus Contubernalis alkalaceticus]
MKAIDIMHKNVIAVDKEASLREAAVLMSKHGIGGLPVVDDFGSIVGIITDSDILKYRQKINLPEYLRLLEYFYEEIDPKRIEADIRAILNKKVKDVMSTRLVMVTEEALIREIISKFAEHHISRIPVVKENKLLGIIAREDVIKVFVEKY